LFTFLDVLYDQICIFGHLVTPGPLATKESMATSTTSTTTTTANRRPITPTGESPLQPQTDERRQREERILDAAAALLVRWGYRKTTIDDVAREAGVGKGTIYLHWKDKNKLFSAAIWRASRQASEEMMRRVAADPEGGLFHRVWTHGMLAVFSN